MSVKLTSSKSDTELNKRGRAAAEEEEDAEIEDETRKLREEQKKKRKGITLFRAPLQTSMIFGIVMWENIQKGVQYLMLHRAVSLAVSLFIIATTITFYVSGPENETIYYVEETFYDGVWWIVLGILSSVGLGTGLHTFVLYLGPMIAKATLTATECNSVDFDLYGPDRFMCPLGDPVSDVEITFWEILRKVQFDALMWGIGTAIGELPPYFVARAARLSGETLKEMDAEEDDDDDGLFGQVVRKVKPIMYAALGNLGFFGILLFASVPNPLFDLAGITCGHFLIPFTTFFGATVIGKAFFKAHLQTIFVIIVFNKKRLDDVVIFVEWLLPFLNGKLHAIIESEKAKLHRVDGQAISAAKEKSLLSLAWDIFLAAMLLYFLVSIIDASVQQYLCVKDEEQIQKLKKKRNAKAH